VGLCFGQCPRPEGAGEGRTPLCQLIVAEWEEYLRTSALTPPTQVAAAAAFG
jgi:hypothetical protein